MEEPFSRTELLLGKENMEKLKKARVCIFGIGGVGGYVAEALARSGVGHLELVDSDVVSPSNLNRQIIATRDTLGRPKAEVMKERILSVNPEAEVITHRCFYLPETEGQFDFTRYDYVVDAIDTVAGKISLAVEAEAAGTPLISSMGAGNKLDPAAFRVADIYDTRVCPLARVMRKELKKRGVKRLKVVYSRELPVGTESVIADGNGEADAGNAAAVVSDTKAAAGTKIPEPETSLRRSIPGSVSFVPAVAGLIMAGEVVRDLTGVKARHG